MGDLRVSIENTKRTLKMSARQVYIGAHLNALRKARMAPGTSPFRIVEIARRRNTNAKASGFFY